MSTPGIGSILGSSIIYGAVDFGPTFGKVYRPVSQIEIIVDAGNYTVKPFDQSLIFKKTVPAAFSVLLPDLDLWMKQPYGGFPLVLKDGAYNAGTYPITIIPFGTTQTIENRTSLDNPPWQIGQDGVGLIVAPLADRTGWQIL